MKHEKAIQGQRRRRGFRVRNRLKRGSTRPRLSVFRSHKHMYAQVVDDARGCTLAAASTLDKEIRETAAYGGNVRAAQCVGEAVARRALAAGVKQVVFDRREYKYHGRVAALADAARDAGLDLGPKKVAPVVEEPKEKKKGPKKEKSPAKKEKAADKKSQEKGEKKSEKKSDKKSGKKSEEKGESA